MDEIAGDMATEPRAEMDGGTGDEARDVGRDVAGEDIAVVTVVMAPAVCRSGCDTELTQHRLDRRESLRMGRLPEGAAAEPKFAFNAD